MGEIEENPTFFLSHHKSGTRYIGLVFEEICRFLSYNYEELNNPKWFGFYATSHLSKSRPLYVKYMNSDYNYMKNIGNFRGFHVIRDPRDLAISAYFSHLHSHSVDWWPELVEHRARLASLNYTDGLLADLEFTDQLPTDGFPIRVFPSMAEWNYADERILEMQFEDFARDPFAAFTRAFAFIGLIDGSRQDQLDRLAQIIALYSFENMSGGRRPGQTDDRHHYRSGTPGEWKQRLDPVHLRWFEERYPALLRRFDTAMPETTD